VSLHANSGLTLRFEQAWVWGKIGAREHPGASATLKLILGGLAGDDLREISDLAGDYRETVITWQRSRDGYSVSSSLQDRKTIRPDEVRTLSAREREALVIHATTRPVKARLTRHYESPHRRDFAASVQEARRIAGLDPPEGTTSNPAYPRAGGEGL
jgi:type IV secretion system protein VirD4